MLPKREKYAIKIFSPFSEGTFGGVTVFDELLDTLAEDELLGVLDELDELLVELDGGLLDELNDELLNELDDKPLDDRTLDELVDKSIDELDEPLVELSEDDVLDEFISEIVVELELSFPEKGTSFDNSPPL